VRNIFLLLVFFITLHNLQAQHQLSLTKQERLFQKGMELIAHTEYGAARKVFTEYLEITTASDPRRSDAEYYVAFSALNLSNNDGEKLIDNFITNNPASPKAGTAYFDLANFFYNEKNYTKSIQYYKKAEFVALTSSQQTEGRFRWGYSYFNLKRLDEALEQFNIIKSQSTEYSPAANYYAGFIEYSKGDYDNALTDLKRSESNSSYANVVPFLIANVYYKQRKYDELLNYATAVKDRKDISNQKEFAMLVAEAYYFKGDYTKAAENYEEYFTSSPKAETALLFRAGYANYSLNKNQKAIEYLTKAAGNKDSVSYYASYYLGVMYLQQGDKNLAINAFHSASKVPNDAALAEEASFQYGKVLYDAGKPEQSITEFEKFLQDFRTSSHANEVKELLAQAYVNGNNYHKAIEYIESLPSRNPQIEQAYQKATYLKGAELFNKDDYQGAVEHFEKSLKSAKDPKYVAIASYWAGEAYSIGKRYGEAVSHYEKVLANSSASDPDILLKTRYGLGYVYYNLKSYDKALQNFKEFINSSDRSDPNHVDAYIRLGDSYYVTKQYPQAIEAYTKARNIGSPDNDYILLQSGVINGIQRNYEQSRADLTALIKSYPRSQYRDEALFQRGQFEIEQGNYQAAVDGLSQLIRESPNSKFLPYAYMRRAASHFNTKQYDRTISDYSTVLTQFSTHPVAQEALLPLQEALTIAGRSGDFEKYLADFKKTNPDNKNLEQIEFETAKTLYFDQQYVRALEKLNAFITAYTSSARLQEAKYYMAESHYRLNDFTKALPAYTELSRDQSFSMGNRVEGRIAEIQFKLGKYEDAIAHYHRLEKIATNKKEQYNAWAGLMESFYLLAQHDSSTAYARTIIDKGAVNASAHNKASLYLGKNAYAKGDHETAQDEFLNTVNAAQDEYGAEAKYMIAMIQYQQKQYKPSYETLISLSNDFSAYDEWVGKAFLLMADDFVGLDNIFQARATLQSLIDDFPMESIREQARVKLREIDKLEAEKQKTESDTTENNR
jgi:tetratricopeptide (TPR) repeat protein